MTAIASHRHRRSSRRALLLATGTVLLAAAPASAAEQISGPTTITFTGSAFSSQGIKAEAKGRATLVKNAETKLARYVVPTRQGVFGANNTTVKHDGSIVLRRRSGGKTRRITLSALELRLKQTSVVSAKVQPWCSSGRITAWALRWRDGGACPPARRMTSSRTCGPSGQSAGALQ